MANPPTKTCPLCSLRYDAAAVFCQKDGARLTADASVDPFLGKVILGQFRIEEAIGAGGMGTVYRAHQTNLSRDVAVKILHPELTKNSDAVRRFHREAKVATSLEHPNLVRVFLFGELPDDGGLYLVMEYLHGRSLMEVMRKNGPLPIERALHMSNQLCSAIGAAHAKGIVHRDVKPDNIIITERHGDPDFVKVLDFGIARLLWDEQSQLTQSGTIFGTARYISPEGAAGEFTDARSDVYSIGVLLYQMLSGVTPFESSSPMSMLMKHINDPAPDLRTMGAGANVPEPIVDVIMRALAKNPDARYATAHELGDALANAAMEAGVVLPGRSSLLPGDSFADMSSAGMRISTVERTRPPTGAHARDETMQIAGLPNRRWPMAVGAFLIGVVVMVGGAAAIRSMTEEEVVVDPMAETLTRARAALAAGHFQTPEHENVAELTQEILNVAPENEAALALRAEAAVLLGSRGHEEHEAGHDDEARLAFTAALVFAPGDPAASAALEALDEHEHHDEAGVSLAPSEATTGERVLFLGVIGHEQEIDGTPRFEVVRGDRILRSIEADLASDQHHYVASYAFRAHGEYSIRFVVPTHSGDVVYTAQLPIVRRGRRPVAHQQPAQVLNPWARPDPTPTPTPTPTMDDGIDWTVPSDMSGSAPPPWTGNGNVL